MHSLSFFLPYPLSLTYLEQANISFRDSQMVWAWLLTINYLWHKFVGSLALGLVNSIEHCQLVLTNTQTYVQYYLVEVALRHKVFDVPDVSLHEALDQDSIIENKY